MFFQPICVNESLPIITLVDHVEHFVYDASKDEQLAQFRFEHQYGVLLGHLNKVELLQQSVGRLANGSLHCSLIQVKFPWDVNLLRRHTPLACLTVHAEVAVFEGVACCVERDGAIPGKDPR